MDPELENSDKQAALASIAGLSSREGQLPREFLGSSGQGDCSISIPEKLSAENSLDQILCFARKASASDVHLSANNPIFLRKFGTLQKQSDEIISLERMEALLKQALDPKILSEFQKNGDLEFVYTINGAGRFRITMMKNRLGLDFTARVIPLTIRQFEDSGMPESCRNLTKWTQGLILITGPAGCGKTSTLATLVEMINQTRHDHIITLERPIEIVYTPKHCQITQREIKTHTLSEHNALRAALREDPDIIVVSELRDLTTIQLAVTAAETGHLVFGTMNTNDAAQTISTLVNSFPPEDQSIITNMISESLRGVICQQLIPRKDGTGVAIAHEVLITNAAVSNMMRSGKIQQIGNAIATGKSSGMVLLDHSLQRLVTNGIISAEEAQARAISQMQISGVH